MITEIETYKLPAKAYTILRYIASNGQRTQKELDIELGFSLRSLRYSLDRLERGGFLVKRANLADMRSLYYCLTVIGQEIVELLQVTPTPIFSGNGDKATA